MGRNYTTEVSEATKRVFKAEAIERAYDTLIAQADSFLENANEYKTRFEDAQKEQDGPQITADCYEYQQYQIYKTRAEIYTQTAKDLLKV